MASVSSFPFSPATRDHRRQRAILFLRSRPLEWGDPVSAAEALVAYCGAEFPRARASVLRLDPVTGLPELVAGGRGAAGPYLEAGSDGLREVMFAQAIRTGEPQRREAAGPHAQGTVPHRLPVRSEVVVPVVTPRSVWGLIHLEHPDSGAFSAEMEEAVEIVAAQVAIFLDSVSADDSGAQRADRLRRRLREMSALCALSERFARAGTLHGVLQRVAEGAAELMECEMSTVLLEAGDGENLEIVAASGTPIPVIGQRVPLEGSMSGWVARHGVHRTTMDPAAPPDAFRTSGDAVGIRNTLIVPLRNGAEIFGTLTVSNRAGAGPYSPDDVELLANLAGHAAAAIESSRLMERLRRRLSESAAVAEVARAVTGTLAMEEVLSLVVREAEALVSGGGAGVSLAVDRDTLRIAAATGLVCEMQGGSIPMDGSLMGLVVATGEAVITENFSEDPRAFCRNLGYGPAAVVPLVVRGQGIGALFVARPPGAGALLDEDVEAVRSLASYAGIALHNAGLHERLESKAAELQRTNAELQASQDQLVVSEKMAALGRVTAGIAHEINSPLGGVLNALQLIRSYAEEYGSSLDDPEVGVDDHREIAHDILTALSLAEAGVTKATQFVRSIKAQTRTGEERRLVFSAAEEVEATTRLLEHELVERGITLINELDPSAELLGDPGRFALVVQNLVSNAADSYEERPGAVHIRLRSEEERVVLEVEDGGSGIPEELRGRVFDYLFTTKEVGRGTGLGLSIVHSVVTTHFLGEVGFTTRPGEGTLFTVHIPRCPPSVD
jgi:signal transduction histidine kinase